MGSMQKRTFFDQWHRIAAMRVGLRAGVTVRLHHYGGEPWYVLYEAAHCGFFRIRPEHHALVMGLSPEMTLDRYWRQAVERNPEHTPGQQEFYELITKLYQGNLLHIEGGVDEDKLAARPERKKKKPLPARIAELLFFRVPLWDPEPWLRRNVGWIRGVYSPPVMLAVAVLFAFALYVFMLNSDRAMLQSSTVLQLSNAIPLYFAIFGSHVIHEMSHAMVCKYHGGHVRTMGVMFLLFTPLPYVDLTASWAFRDRLHRAYVGAAGMFADLVTCSIATIIWANSPPGMINELSYNLMLVTAAYTVFFNINPLMRFDGYYVLSDLADVPNLHEQANNAFQRFWRRTILRRQDPEDALVSGRKQLGLFSFFVLSNIYRIIIMVGIVIFVADQYFGLGLLVAVALMVTTFVNPLKKPWQSLRDPAFMARHQGLVRWMGGSALVVVLAIAFVPLPYSQRLHGVLETELLTRVYAATNGIVEQVMVQPGDWVTEGQVVLTMRNPEMEMERRAVEAQLARVETELNRAFTEGSQLVEPLMQRKAALAVRFAYLDAQQEALVIRALHAGRWVGEQPLLRMESWVARGHEFGSIAEEGRYVFLGIVRQESATELGALASDRMTLWVEGARGFDQPLSGLTVTPYSQDQLPSAALGAIAGNDGVAISMDDPQGRKALEKFFLIKAWATDDLREAVSGPVQGRSGWIRVELPPRSLGTRLFQSAQQFLQRRYAI
jgi:putative peptide zinc metalloprotease protein